MIDQASVQAECDAAATWYHYYVNNSYPTDAARALWVYKTCKWVLGDSSGEPLNKTTGQGNGCPPPP